MSGPRPWESHPGLRGPVLLCRLASKASIIIQSMSTKVKSLSVKSVMEAFETMAAEAQRRGEPIMLDFSKPLRCTLPADARFLDCDSRAPQRFTVTNRTRFPK